MKMLIIIMMMPMMLMGVSQAVAQTTDSLAEFRVEGLCAMCKKRIEDAAKHKGVHEVTWDVRNKMLTLLINPSIVSITKIQQQIAATGHDAGEIKASDEAYNKLPSCCRYRDKPADASEEITLANQVMGVIMEEDEKGTFKPLKGASISVDRTSKGTLSDESGFFAITIDQPVSVTVSYVGFEPKSFEVKPGDHLSLVLNISKPLEGIKVVSTRKAAYISPLSTIRTQVMTERELFKAACCNLSESFETNPSVDVSFSDAITGAKQIQLLGLSGNYTQLTVESMPGPRGLAIPWGLNSIPGTWVESIQLSKGVGSVANGFESIAGQINVELKKPAVADQLFANVYVNNMGKTDLNLNLAKRLSKKWSTALLLHDAFLNNTDVDFNKDGFRDLPTGNLFSVMNRWQYDNQEGWMGQVGVRLLVDNKISGETRFDPSTDKLNDDVYGLGIDTRRYEVFAKVGHVFPGKKYKSIGLQLSAFHHGQEAYFGQTNYDATQRNFYANLIYQSIIGNTDHKFRTGLSWIADKYDETFRANKYQRTESVPGAFFEYTYTHSENYSLVAGIRGDQNSLFGFFVTPRLHMRYEPVKGTVIRLAGGRGQRTANIFAENTSVLVSSRDVNIIGGNSKAYGLKPEVAWNEGLSIDQSFRLGNRAGSIGLDFFRTDFENQVVVDLDRTARTVDFYNLAGKSYSNSLQATINYEVLPKLELRLAYRVFDVKTDYHGELLQKPLLAKSRGFANVAYERAGWKLDYTITITGTKRIPFTGDNPVAYQLDEYSPSFVTMNAQISKSLSKKIPLEVYVGGENLGNYYQQKVIVGADQPFSPYFDASLVWGPVSGRMFYAGARFRIK